jgi:PAS domain S-box-containing protein
MATSSNKTFEKTRAEISFRDILEVAPVGILIFQSDWKIKYVNNNFFQFGGILAENSSEVIGKSVFDNRLFSDLDIRDSLNIIKSGSTFEKEIINSQTLSGGKISLYLKGAPLILAGEYSGGILILEDLKVDLNRLHLSIAKSADFQSFLTQISDFFIIIDNDGIVKHQAQGDYDTFDFLFEKNVVKISSALKKVSSAIFKNLIGEAAKSNKVISTQIPFIKKSTHVNAKLTLIPFSEDGFENNLIIILVLDMSLHQEKGILSEEEIAELSKYQQITATILDGLIGINKNGKIVFWNESAAELFGLTRSEVYGKPIGKIFSSIDEKEFERLKEEVSLNNKWEGKLSIGGDESIAEYFRVKMGIVGDDGDKTYFLVCTNITEDVRHESELIKSEERFRNIVTNSHDYICTLDLRGKITYANPKFLDVFQYSDDELKKLSFIDLIDSYYLMNETFKLSDIAGNELNSIELPLTTKLGQPVYVLASFAKVMDIRGAVQFYNAILTDITLKKESEKDLLLIRSVFEASQDGIALISKKRFVLLNDSCVKMFGFKSASEMLGQYPLNFVDEKDKERIAGFIDQAEEGKETITRFNFTGHRKNESTFELEISISFYKMDDERFSVWVLRDITEEKEAQDALQISEERYRGITENINECIWTAENRNGQLNAVFYTPAIKKITSYEAQAFIDDPELWGKIIHPDDVEYVDTKLDKLYGDPARNIETLGYRIIDSLGNVIWIENKITVVRDDKSMIQKLFGIISDVSLAKRIQEELKKSAADLKELNETKDRFISIISHDLRTPFSSLIGFTDLLLTEKDIEEDKRTQYIEFIQESSKSMLSLVNSLLDWTRLQTGRYHFEPERINTKSIITKSIQILSGASIQKNITLINSLDKDFYIHADEGLILQVFNNLITNAIKFTKPGGTVRISANANIEKRQMEFSIQDNGIGIKKEDIEKLFKVDTKFTTDGTTGEKGSGLGLSLVHEIIRKHGGDIWVKSEKGQGATFTFSVPVASTSILLIDDIKTDRLLYAKLLKNLMPNYTILEAENGKQGLDIIKQSSPALVITDHKMPVMTGYDLVTQLNISELRYKPPVIILSSDINKLVEAEYKDLGVEYIFQKPVNLTNFKTAIDRSLRKAFFN